MDQELAELASVAATTVVKALASTAWEQAQKAIGALWYRAHPDRAATVEADLAETRTDLLAARSSGDEDAECDLVSEWQSRLRRLLATDPLAAEDLRRLADDLQTALSGVSQWTERVDFRARASGHGRVYQAGRDLHVGE